MDKFIVSSRKYRPQTFDTVVGQSHITTTLKNAIILKQLAHAFLFCGPRGVGKTTCARILAKTINCENPTKDGEACGKCQSCISFNEGASLNYFELDAASNNSVENIRELVDQVRFLPQTGKYKVYVIDEVHMLSSSAFNAFLKTLEEPPPYAIFILATTEKHKILPTILSRCQIFDFKRISINDVVEHLQQICEKENVKAEKAALQIIAQKSEGCMRDALSIFDKIVSFTNGEVNYINTLEHLNILDAELYFNLLNCMQQQDLSGALLLFDDINRKGFEGDLVLNGFAEFFRNLLVCKDEKAAVLLEVVEGFRDRFIETAKKVSFEWLISALNIINESEINYKAARNKRLHVEMALIRLCYLQQALHIVAGSEDIIKKKIIDSSVPLRVSSIRPYTGAGNSKQAADTPVAKVVIQTPEKMQTYVMESSPEIQKIPETEAQQEERTTKLTPLDKIRNQFRSDTLTENGISNRALEIDLLQKAWNDYIQKLRTEKNPAARSFAMAHLQIKDENSFEVVISNTVEREFIEQERNKLVNFLKEKLQNSLLQFMILIDETSPGRRVTEFTFTVKEQFQKMAERYPLVKELKDRLRLELDY